MDGRPKSPEHVLGAGLIAGGHRVHEAIAHCIGQVVLHRLG
jgi:hypothetical protein